MEATGSCQVRMTYRRGTLGEASSCKKRGLNRGANHHSLSDPVLQHLRMFAGGSSPTQDAARHAREAVLRFHWLPLAKSQQVNTDQPMLASSGSTCVAYEAAAPA
jgi:hypothetical protein